MRVFYASLPPPFPLPASVRSLLSPPRFIMRRLSAILVLCAWLFANGAHWDLVQSFAWGRMIATYSQSMPLAEAIRLTFTADNLCGVCEFVADGKTRADSDGNAPDALPRDPAAKATLILAAAPEHCFVFASASASAPKWPAEHFRPDACARPAPPTEPPRAV